MKRYIIFGATGGIGRECANILAQHEDVSLVCVSRSETKLDRLKQDLGLDHDYISMDLSEKGAVEDLFESNKDQDLFDGVVFAAGIEGIRPIRTMSADFFEDVFRVNCGAFMQICKCMASKRLSKEGASIVAVSSLTAVNLSNSEGAYGVSKAALNAVVKQASMELIGRGIRVNAILPASTETDMMDKVRERIVDFDEKLPSIQPLGMIPPIQVAYLVEFLLSDRASFVTGACIPISAGRKFY